MDTDPVQLWRPSNRIAAASKLVKLANEIANSLDTVQLHVINWGGSWGEDDHVDNGVVNLSPDQSENGSETTPEQFGIPLGSRTADLANSFHDEVRTISGKDTSINKEFKISQLTKMNKPHKARTLTKNKISKITEQWFINLSLLVYDSVSFLGSPGHDIIDPTIGAGEIFSDDLNSSLHNSKTILIDGKPIGTVQIDLRNKI